MINHFEVQQCAIQSAGRGAVYITQLAICNSGFTFATRCQCVGLLDVSSLVKEMLTSRDMIDGSLFVCEQKVGLSKLKVNNSTLKIALVKAFGSSI